MISRLSGWELMEILKFENITLKHLKIVMANEMMSLT